VVIGALLLVAGVGMGTLSGPLGPITLARVDRNHAGVAGAMHKTMQQIGGAMGTALIATVYFSMTADHRPPVTAFLIATWVVAADLLAIALLLTRLPERLFD